MMSDAILIKDRNLKLWWKVWQTYALQVLPIEEFISGKIQGPSLQIVLHRNELFAE